MVGADRAEGDVDQRALVGRARRRPGGGERPGAPRGSGCARRRAGVAGSSSAAGMSVKYGRPQQALAAAGRAPGRSGAQLVDARRRSTGITRSSLPCWEMPTQTDGHADDLGRQRAGELRDLADDDVGPPGPAGGEDARGRRRARRCARRCRPRRARAGRRRRAGRAPRRRSRRAPRAGGSSKAHSGRRSARTIGAASRGAAMRTSAPARWKARAKGISGPKCPAPALVVMRTRMRDQTRRARGRFL